MEDTGERDTLDIEVAGFHVLGVSGAVAAIDRLSRERPVAASFLGGSMLILGLVLIKPRPRWPGSGGSTTCWPEPDTRRR